MSMTRPKSHSVVNQLMNTSLPDLLVTANSAAADLLAINCSGATRSDFPAEVAAAPGRWQRRRPGWAYH